MQIQTIPTSSLVATRNREWLASLPEKLRNVLCLDDFEIAARAHLPRPIFGYVAGGVENCLPLRGNRTAFDAWSLIPRILVDVSQRSQQVTLFGETYAAPFGIAPLGITALSAYEGDIVLARAAQAAMIPMVLSGASLIPMEEVSAVAPRHTWFQAYLSADEVQIRRLLERVTAAAFPTLVVTVDTATLANRENNLRVGFSTPLRPSARLAWEGVTHPSWLLGTMAKTLLNRGMPHFENQNAMRGAPIISREAVRQFGMREQLSWKHLAFIRKIWKGRLVLKGVLALDDFQRAVEHGVDGVIVSNHGGRQLDGAAAPVDVLAAMADQKGSVQLMVDSGFRRGTDVLKALCLGADFVFLGRPFVYAAAVGGARGVTHAIDLMFDEIRRDMALLGVTQLSELDRRYLQAARS
jgi:L-lactate dehydrogenase (cytochrome)